MGHIAGEIPNDLGKQQKHRPACTNVQATLCFFLFTQTVFAVYTHIYLAYTH